MNKGKAVWLLRNQGDGILVHRDADTRLVSEYLCTIDFKNRYIRKQTRGKKPWPKEKTDIVVFNWTTNKYWILNPKDIIKIQPLADVLNNVRDS